MKKRLVAVLLVAAMSMSLLTACRDSGENKATVDIEQTDYDPEEEVKNFEFGELSDEEKINHIGVESRTSLNEIVDYIYEHFDEFKLIICKSEGTSYENFIHNMVEIEVEETYQFIDALRSQGKHVPNIEKAVCHMIVSGMFSGIFELIEHDMKKENAKKYVSEFQDFYIAGWSKILGL